MLGQLATEACELAELGYHLLPVTRGTKKPAFEQTGPGHADAASCDPATVERWFRPDQHDVAIVPWLSGHAVADVDTKNGQPGATSLPKLEEQSGYSMRRRWIDVTATALSANRGWHYWWTLPAGVEPGMLRGQLAPGVELRCRGLVVVPPSQGRRWVRHLRDGCLEMPAEIVATARKPLRAAVPAGSTAIRSTAGLHKWLLRAPPGERNSCLHWAACRAAEMLERGEISEAHVWAFVEAGVRIGQTQREAESTVRSALGSVLGDAGPAPPAAVALPTVPVGPTGQLVIAETGELVDTPRREPFEQIPCRVAESGLTDGQLALLVRVWLLHNHRTGVSVTTTSELAGTPDSAHRAARKVRRRLRELRDLGWLQFDLDERQRRPLEIRLGRQARGG